MDWWIVKQLRAKVLEDLHEFIPENYFETEAEKFKLDKSIKNSTHYSSELQWGYLAAKLGLKLFFKWGSKPKTAEFQNLNINR